MSVDRQKLWGIVSRQREAFQAAAAEGYAAIVELTVAGRPGPLVVHRAEMPRNPDLPWTVFSVFSKEGGEPPQPEDSRLLVHDDHIQGIEVRFMRTNQPEIAFTYGELDDDAS
jgi:hypothetical protein